MILYVTNPRIQFKETQVAAIYDLFGLNASSKSANYFNVLVFLVVINKTKYSSYKQFSGFFVICSAFNQNCNCHYVKDYFCINDYSKATTNIKQHSYLSLELISSHLQLDHISLLFINMENPSQYKLVLLITAQQSRYKRAKQIILSLSGVRPLQSTA